MPPSFSEPVTEGRAVSPTDVLNDDFASSIESVPVTKERKPFVEASRHPALTNAGAPRANIAASRECPQGTTKDKWAARHSQQTVLQQHCDFFDTDRDGVIWPRDTFMGFHRLGFGIILSAIALFIIHINFSYVTQPGWLPDPMFRLYVKNIHKTKHGSDSGTFDHEGRFIPQHFEDIFEKYAGGRDYLTLEDLLDFLKGQRLASDPIGWCGAIFEWGVTYIMLWPADGKMMKEDIRGVFDGSLFYTIEARRAAKGA